MGEKLSGRRERSAGAAAERAKPWGASWPFLGTSPLPWPPDPPDSPYPSGSSKALGAESDQGPHSGEQVGSGTVWVQMLLQRPCSHGHTSTTWHGTAQHRTPAPCPGELLPGKHVLCTQPLSAQHSARPRSPLARRGCTCSKGNFGTAKAGSSHARHRPAAQLSAILPCLSQVCSISTSGMPPSRAPRH